MQIRCEWLLACVRAFTALLLIVVPACVPSIQARASALWSRAITGGVVNASIDHGAVIFGVDSRPLGGENTLALDLRTGKRLWERTGAVPLAGSPAFLAVGTSVEHVDERTGRAMWRSVPLCVDPGTVAAIGNAVFVGCGGGKLLALRLSTGRVFAAAHPTQVDTYDQIVPLGRDALGIGGEASGAFLFRQSAIVTRGTLATFAALERDTRIIGERGGNAVVAETCCLGRHSDSSPADIEFVSLDTGKTVSAVSLHPYENPPPPDRDVPGAGIVLAVGSTLYVATHSALFAYDLGNLGRQPRTLYADLADEPMITAGRYLWIKEGTPGNVRRVAYLDAYAGMRVIWSGTGGEFTTVHMYSPGEMERRFIFSKGRVRLVMVDGSCTVQASSANYAFTICRNSDIASRVRLGSPGKPVTRGQKTLSPGAIAVYASNGT